LAFAVFPSGSWASTWYPSFFSWASDTCAKSLSIGEVLENSTRPTVICVPELADAVDVQAAVDQTALRPKTARNTIRLGRSVPRSRFVWCNKTLIGTSFSCRDATISTYQSSARQN
jgi:hypothetical protein